MVTDSHSVYLFLDINPQMLLCHLLATLSRSVLYKVNVTHSNIQRVISNIKQLKVLE